MFSTILSPVPNMENTMKLRLTSLFAVCAAITLVAGSARAEPPSSGSVSTHYVMPHMRHAPYGELHIVVPLSSGEKPIQMIKLRNIANSLDAAAKWGGSLDVKVVLYARGVSLLVDPDEGTRKQLDALRAKHVQFEVCNNSLAEQNIDFHSLYGVKETEVVPAGFAEVAYLQARHHYVVDPMN